MEAIAAFMWALLKIVFSTFGIFYFVRLAYKIVTCKKEDKDTSLGFNISKTDALGNLLWEMKIRDV